MCAKQFVFIQPFLFWCANVGVVLESEILELPDKGTRYGDRGRDKRPREGLADKSM